MVSNIKPRILPFDIQIGGLIKNVLPFFPRTQGDFRTSYLRNFAFAWMGAQKEQIAEQIEMGLDAQKCFAKMSKNGKMKDRIGSQMMKLDLPMMQKTSEEI